MPHCTDRKEKGEYTLCGGICSTHFMVPSIFWNWFISSRAVYNRNEADTSGIWKHSYTQFSVSWQQETQQNNNVILIFLQKFTMYQLLQTKRAQIHWLTQAHEQFQNRAQNSWDYKNNGFILKNYKKNIKFMTDCWVVISGVS